MKVKRTVYNKPQQENSIFWRLRLFMHWTSYSQRLRITLLGIWRYDVL